MNVKNSILFCAFLTSAISASHAHTGKGLCGFYLGGHAGGSFSHMKYDFDDGPGGVNLASKGTSSSFKPALGMMLGYNYIVGKSILLGAEIGFDGLLNGDTLVTQ